jgi:hypothetical protein
MSDYFCIFYSIEIIYKMSVVSGYDASGAEIGGLSVGKPLTPAVAAGKVQMSLLALNKLVNIGAVGIISSGSYDISFNKWDAVANCDISLNSFRDMFVIQTDGDDINDASDNDIKFYIDPSGIPLTLSLNNSVVYSGKVAEVDALNQTLADQSLSKDYVRHLADILFNTPYGADLFINEGELLTSVNTALTQIWSSCVTDLQSISTTGTNTNLTGNLGHKYLLATAVDASGNNSLNICRELYKRLAGSVPERFANLTSLKVGDPQSGIIDPSFNNLYYLPLEAGDQILMRVVLMPSPSQNSFAGTPSENTRVQSDTRAYIIALRLT